MEPTKLMLKKHTKQKQEKDKRDIRKAITNL